MFDDKIDTVKRKPARYKVTEEQNGRVFTFFCDISGAALWKSKPICAFSQIAEYETAWNEAKQHINACHKCGRNVIDALYNAETMECVKCSPWHKQPVYCDGCGEKLIESDSFCRKCGKRISEEGVDEDAECQRM